MGLRGRKWGWGGGSGGGLIGVHKHNIQIRSLAHLAASGATSSDNDVRLHPAQNNLMGDHGFDRAAARALGVLVGSDQPVLREKIGVGVDFVDCQIPFGEKEA